MDGESSNRQQPEERRNPNQSSAEDKKKLWIGNLDHWMNEDYVYSCFSKFGTITTINVYANKRQRGRGQPAGYGFVEFSCHEEAELALRTCYNTNMPYSNKPYCLNWATVRTVERGEPSSEYEIFVHNLAHDVTDRLLHETFAARYPSVTSARVMRDHITARSRGFGFVMFRDEGEQLRALVEMNGVKCSYKAMLVQAARPKEQ